MSYLNEVNKINIKLIIIIIIFFFCFFIKGFIGVVLRGQRVDEYGRASKELDIPGALEHERQFFLNDPSYR